jgi:hypothetical protein
MAYSFFVGDRLYYIPSLAQNKKKSTPYEGSSELAAFARDMSSNPAFFYTPHVAF